MEKHPICRYSFLQTLQYNTLFLLLVLSIFSCKKEDVVEEGSMDVISVHLTLGNPSGATADVSNASNYLMIKQQYALSYNRDRAIPNWVSWHLDQGWLGSAPRQDDFRADPSLPQGWYRVQGSDYTNSGFDRGHNTPSADRTKSLEDNSATFLMTNMIPQAPDNNQGVWANLESYCRKLVADGNELYIIMGNYGIGGSGSMGAKTTIANGQIIVPSRIWKVIVVLSSGNNDAERIIGTTRIIAVDTPNTNNLNSQWGSYRTSVDAIEGATGYDLLSRVALGIQQIVEAKVDTGPTN